MESNQEQFRDRQAERERPIRRIADIGMGLIYIGMGLIIAFPTLVRVENELLPYPFNFIFAGILGFYGLFRLYRVFKPGF